MYKTPGMEVRPENAKLVPSAYNLRIPTGGCILFSVSGALLKFFRAKTRPENAVVMPGTEVGALFRIACMFDWEIVWFYGFCGLRHKFFRAATDTRNAVWMHSRPTRFIIPGNPGDSRGERSINPKARVVLQTSRLSSGADRRPGRLLDRL